MAKRLEAHHFDRLMEIQRGRCAICGSEPSETRALAVDHDHTTELVRGLLCSRCNLGLGYFLDDPRLLRRAVEYLEDHASAFMDWCPNCHDSYEAPRSVRPVDGEPGRIKTAYRCRLCEHIWGGWWHESHQWL